MSPLLYSCLNYSKWGQVIRKKYLIFLQMAFLTTYSAKNAFAPARTILHALLSQRPIYMCQTKLFAR